MLPPELISSNWRKLQRLTDADYIREERARRQAALDKVKVAEEIEDPSDIQGMQDNAKIIEEQLASKQNNIEIEARAFASDEQILIDRDRDNRIVIEAEI